MARFGPQIRQMPQEQIASIQGQLQQMVMSQLVSKTLLLNEANKQKIKSDDKEVAHQIKELSSQLPEDMTLEKFTASIGSTPEELKKRIADDTKVTKMLVNITADVPNPEASEVKQYYDDNTSDFSVPESVTASHILVSTRDLTDDSEIEKKKALIDQIRGKLLDKDSGSSFEDLASAHSDCPSKAQGGDLGAFGRGRMDPVFEQAAFTQKVGDIGEPVKTGFGYHIIKVTEKQEAKQLAFEEVKDRLGSDLHQQRKQKKISDFIEELRGKATIENPLAKDSKEDDKAKED